MLLTVDEGRDDVVPRRRCRGQRPHRRQHADHAGAVVTRPGAGGHRVVVRREHHGPVGVGADPLDPGDDGAHGAGPHRPGRLGGHRDQLLLHRRLQAQLRQLPHEVGLHRRLLGAAHRVRLGSDHRQVGAGAVERDARRGFRPRLARGAQRGDTGDGDRSQHGRGQQPTDQRCPATTRARARRCRCGSRFRAQGAGHGARTWLSGTWWAVGEDVARWPRRRRPRQRHPGWRDARRRGGRSGRAIAGAAQVVAPARRTAVTMTTVSPTSTPPTRSTTMPTTCGPHPQSRLSPTATTVPCSASATVTR